MQALVYNGPGQKGLEEHPDKMIDAATDAIIQITRTTIRHPTWETSTSWMTTLFATTFIAACAGADWARRLFDTARGRLSRRHLLPAELSGGKTDCKPMNRCGNSCG